MADKWVQKYLSESEITDISKAVQAVEQSTSGEIVPMIVHRSSAIRHVPVILGLSFALLFLGVEMLGVGGWYLNDWMPFLLEHWGYQVLFLILLMVLAWWLSHLQSVQRFLTSDQDEKDQVEKRAQLEFFLHRLNHTNKKTGILIFVSVMERRAVILADEGIAKVLPPQTWNEVLKPLMGQLKKGSWSDGFQEAIKQTGGLLQTHFPSSTSANELSNQLIIKE
ncbi:TPM domain-containing protein [Bdellovibrio sp. HCB337]|uniref:TPM domain-containing protein n=1 Tax=Bdellovibrio sp. HCB337 TaxID=3394358 RepID=UPI0039A5FE2D